MRCKLLPSANLTLVLGLTLASGFNQLKSCYASEVDQLDTNYQMSVFLPESTLSISTSKVSIPYNYKLSSTATKLSPAETGAEMRVTFNVLNANCYAFSVFKANYNQEIRGSVATNKCQFNHPGSYVAMATICSKKALGLNELCRTTMGNIKVD